MNEFDTIVLLHYFSGSAESWQYVRRRLPVDQNVVVLDLPGFGKFPMIANPSLRAYSSWVWQQLRQRSIENFVLIGHSMGGKIAMDMAAMQTLSPNDCPPGCRVQRLGLLAPSPATREPMPESKKDELEATHPSVDAAEKMLDESAMVKLSDERRSLAVRTNLQTDSVAWHWWLREGMEHSIVDSVSKIDLPVAVLASDDDPVIPMKKIRQDVVGIVSEGALTQVSGVGHLMPLEDENLVANWIAKV